MARPTRQCPPTVVRMYDPDEDQDDPPPVDWEAWAQSRSFRANRWRLLMGVAIVLAMTALYFQSGGTMIPWGPP